MTDIPSETAPCVIAIVEDEEDFRTEVAAFLEANGFSVWQAGSAEGFYRKMVVNLADLVIVDLGLPGEDGLSLISYLNKTGKLPLVALTGRGTVPERIAGLEAGADYYFVKPVDLYELLAGIRSVLRKRSPTPPQATAPAWRILRSQSVLVAPNAVTVGLTSNEIRLLECLMKDPEATFTKQQLLELFNLVDVDEGFHRIEVMVMRMRTKVLTAANLKLPLRTIYGKGFSFIGHGEIKP